MNPRDTLALGDPGSRVWCAQVELGTGAVSAPAAPTPDESRCRLLVRLHGQVLGYLALDFVPASTDERVLSAAWRRWPEAIRHHLRTDALPAVDDGDRIPSRPASCTGTLTDLDPHETVTVVVCTRDRPEEITRCLTGLRRLSYPYLEILVVDNAPSGPATRDAVAAAAREDPRIRYVVEPRPGLSRARNRGLCTATGRFVAFTDDDVLVDEEWIQGVVRGFRCGPDVACVTGLVCTAQITNDFERFFDARTSSWSTRVSPTVYPPALPRSIDPLYPYSAGRFGTGANFAFRREVFTDLGGFDESLGAGTPCRGGEDLDAFVRVMRAGHTISYEPSAVVWHHHRADLRGLRKQMYAYGVGLSAYLTKLCRHRGTRRDLALRVPSAFAYLVSLHGPTTDDGGYLAPRSARLAEFAGYLSGPVHYALATIRARRNARGAPR